ncbi:MAG: FxLYD domain-containing protein [Chloroflexi bacterium]|nr:FxLYD domain-containing protein [Chloroflexota bacterium]
MKWTAVLLGVALALLSGWALLATDSPGEATTGSTAYLPLIVKQGWLENVTIVQHDGHQAVYWPSPLPASPTPGYYYQPTPTPVAGIPIYLEVQNHTDRNIYGVSVEFRALDASGVLITDTVTQTTTLLDVLAPGQSSPVVFNIPSFPGGYTAFQSAAKDFTVQPGWSYTDWDAQGGLELGWGYPWYPQPPPPYPTPTPAAPAPPYVSGYVRNKGTNTVTGAYAVITIRGNDQASGLVLEAMKVPLNPIYPGTYQTFTAYFGRDYGNLFGSVEGTAERRLDIPGILSTGSW